MTTNRDPDRLLQLQGRVRRLTNPAMAAGHISGAQRRERETRFRQVFVFITLGILLGATGLVANGSLQDDEHDQATVVYVDDGQARVRSGGS